MSRHQGKFSINEDVVRWNSNGSVPPEDCMKEMHRDGEITLWQMAKSTIVYEEETTVFLNEYRKRMETHVHSPEELYEMRAAFGEGAEVVNVVTGKRITL
jgi:hypothetical protein